MTSPLEQLYVVVVVVVDGWVLFVFVVAMEILGEVKFTFCMFDNSGTETDAFAVMVSLIVGEAEKMVVLLA